MNILLDATLPPRFARALNLLVQPAHSVAHVRDLLGNDATDLHVADYLEANSETVLVGFDLDISTQPHRMECIRLWKKPIFLLSAAWMKSDPWEHAWMLSRRLPEIIKKAGHVDSPTVYLIPAGLGGRIRKAA